ncbi:DJ-1/PfpI family protein [Cystobacter fuscus]
MCRMDSRIGRRPTSSPCCGRGGGSPRGVRERGVRDQRGRIGSRGPDAPAQCVPGGHRRVDPPGGDFWMDDTTNQPVLAFAQDLLAQGKMVAAICSATVALGRQGLLDQRRHTSNDLGVLKQEAPGYRGEALYVQSLAVTDGNLITASSIGALEFAREIADYLKLGSESYRKQWYELFKHGVAPPADFWTQS